MAILRRKKKEAASVAAPKKTAVAGTTAVAQRSDANATGWNVLHGVHISEKATALAQNGQYVFVVQPRATKHMVTDAVEAMYGIRPVSVNMIRQRGKRVRFGRRSGTRKAWKKAMVSLPKGKTIQVFEGV